MAALRDRRARDRTAATRRQPLDAGGFRCGAFISYRHRDAKAPSSLQRAIETYRIPGPLVGLATPVGALPDYLKPVFVDQAALPAGADLNVTVLGALATEQALLRAPNAGQPIVDHAQSVYWAGDIAYRHGAPRSAAPRPARHAPDKPVRGGDGADRPVTGSRRPAL